MGQLFDELKRRNVFRVAAAYIVAAWLVIQVVETIFPAFGFGDAAVRIATICLAIGFVVAVIFSWALEITPDGLKLEKNVDRSASITPHTGKKLDRMIILVLVLAVGYFAFDKFVLSGSREATIAESAREEGRAEALIRSYGQNSIAVLPFRDMSPESDQEYFSDGIAEELLNLLAKIKELRVISRTSAFSYKNKDVSIAEIGRQLNVAHVLEGSVRKSGKSIRITAQLIDATTDTHLWSDTWDRELDDVFAIQDEIAAEVVDRLQVSILGNVPTVRAAVPEAYEVYLKARKIDAMDNAESMERAIALYRMAVKLDPSYAPAWVNLATARLNQASYFGAPMDEAFWAAREAAENSIEADPGFASGYFVLSDIALTQENDLERVAHYLQQGLAVSRRNTSDYAYAAFILGFLDASEVALGLLEYVTTHDPLEPIGHLNLGFNYIHEGRFEDAIESFQVVLGLRPEMINAHYGIGKALLLSGQTEKALEVFAKEPNEGYRRWGLAIAHHALGDTEESTARLDAMVNDEENDWTYVIATFYAQAGDADNAFVWLEKGAELGTQELHSASKDQWLKPLHEDPRWLPFLTSINRAPGQLEVLTSGIELPQ